MILPRESTPPTDCPPGHSSCLPNGAGSGSTGPADDDHVSYLPRLGPKRYIGITMVLALLLVFFVWWLLARRRASNSNSDVDSPPAETTAKNSGAPRRPWWSSLGQRWRSSATLTPSDREAPDSPRHPPSQITDSISSEQSHKSEKIKEPRWMSEARVPKGLVKEVSAGMVVYTNGSKSKRRCTEPRWPRATVPRSDRISRSINLNSEWHLERMHNVRCDSEARTSPEGARRTTR